MRLKKNICGWLQTEVIASGLPAPARWLCLVASLSAKTQLFGLPCVTDGVKKTKKQLMSFSHYANALFELQLVVLTTSACQNTMSNCLG